MIFGKRPNAPEQVRSLPDEALCRDGTAGNHDAFLVLLGNRINASDWKVGSRWQHRDADDPNLLDIVGKVVESDPPRRLVLTWAHPADESRPAAHSRVTFEIEPFGDAVRLTITHEDFEPGSEMLRRISYGWPVVLSSLKSLLESGKPMTMTTTRTGWPPRP